MGGDAAEPPADGGPPGGIARATFRSLEEGGPATRAQTYLALVRRLNCTPSQAVRELEENPYAVEMLATDSFETAYRALRDWEALPDDRRRDVPKPSGAWVDRVEAAEAELVREQLAERREALDSE